jgi:8-oxo-dGTP pyrophosphatase MutT (NUDIX family)
MNYDRFPTFIATGAHAPRPELTFEPRDAIAAAVRNLTTGRYLVLRWKKVAWTTFITGGTDGMDAEAAARLEIHQETGYRDLEVVGVLPRFRSKFYHTPKGLNRDAFVTPFLFNLISEDQDPVAADELEKHDWTWLSLEELLACGLPEGHQYMLQTILRCNI